MITRRVLRILLIAAIGLLMFNISPGVAEELTLEPLMAPEVDPTDMGSAFTYQGRLMNGSAPAQGQFDFQIKLFDDPTAGTQIASTITVANHTVNNGLFMVELDFGTGAFTGFERWLEISVRPYSIDSEPYTVLLPRQQINPAPYATFAGTIYRKTVVVKPVGTSAENGNLLLDALASIIGVSSDNRYLLKLEPGVYDIGNNSLVMKEFVDIEGSGETNTIITSAGFNTDTEATVISADLAELRDLTIQCNGGGTDNYATALWSNEGQRILIHVTLWSSDGITATYGMHNNNKVQATLESVSIQASSASGPAFGAYNENSRIDLRNSTLTILGTYDGTGIWNDSGSDLMSNNSQISVYALGTHSQEITGILSENNSSILMFNSLVKADGNGMGDVYAISTSSSGLSFLSESILEASDGAPHTGGIKTENSSGLELFGTKVKAHGVVAGVADTYGIRATTTPLTIRNSQIIAEGDASNVIGIHAFLTTTGENEISGTVIKAISAGNHGVMTGWEGIYISQGQGSVFHINHVAIEVEPFDASALFSTYGRGIYNYGATLYFENSTINSPGKVAYQGIEHDYLLDTGTINKLYVNNSEIYTCLDDENCNAVTVLGSGGSEQETFGFISSSLIWGLPVSNAYPITRCLWVTDENYVGYGWPAMGTILADYTCP
jgi:hypothetical protein